MPRGVNLSKIKRALPDIEVTQELQDLAERLDKKEEVEAFIKSEAGESFVDYFGVELLKCINGILSVDDGNFIPHVERLRVILGFYKSLANAENDAELYRRMVDELIV